ncbi:MAG: glycosyltransferase family 61 protein [Clostridia bacterium]|nr:glycosyltransferase family 61 protein [Clostridia bacterium]
MYSIDYSYLRPLKAENLKKRHNAEFVKRESLAVWQGNNAVVLPLKHFSGDNSLFGRGGVVDANGEYIALSAVERRVQGKYDFEAPFHDDCRAVYCGYLVHHWGHFLVEAVARLWYFLENDSNVDKYVFFLESGAEREITGNYRAFFELLGVWDKIEIINRPTEYRELIVPELGYSWCNYYSEQYKNIFEKIASNVKIDAAWEPADKIYFSRSKLGKASGLEFGLETLDDFFERNGYKILFPEQLPLSRMIYYIRNSDVCATLSGSLPHNMLFARDGQKLIIAERLVLNNEIQVNVNAMKSLDVTYVDSHFAVYPTNMSGPFIIAFTEQLEKFAKDNGLQPPDEKYTSERHLRRCFKKYMKAYKKEYGYRWFMEDWYTKYTDYLWEAYKDAYAAFGAYLSGQKPFLLRHCFELRYIKRLIKRIIK